MPDTADRRRLESALGTAAVAVIIPLTLVVVLAHALILAVVNGLLCWYTCADAVPAAGGWAFAGLPAVLAAAAVLRDHPRAAAWVLLAGVPAAAFTAMCVVAGEGVDAEFATRAARLFRIGAAAAFAAYPAGALLGLAAHALPRLRPRLAPWPRPARILFGVAAAQALALPAAVLAAAG